ncbi:MAG: PD40 domain-containing protein, partial [Ignavibacteriales bacterium]|nr:PD40 domain-containing protein [Ignavibacteriales bacterium]
YYPEMEDLAQRGAAFAEDAYFELQQRYNHTINHRIPLIFYSSHLHFQQTNTTAGFIPEGVGGFFEFLKGRVVIPSSGSTEQFRHVIRHELVHVFMHSKINRVLLDHRTAQDRLPPLWFIEGLAEFWSTPWDTQADMVLRDAVVNNYLVPLNDMDRIYGSFLMYKEGQNICQFMAERFGEEKLLLLMENFWKASSFSEVMKLTVGRNFKEFDDEWLYALKKRYYPKIAGEDMPSRVAKSIVESGFNSKPSFYNNNGKHEVYFIGNHLGYTNLYRVDVDAEKPEPEQLVEGESTDEFEAFHLFQSKIDISKNGLLAFVTKSGENDVLHLYDVAAKSIKETLRFKNLVVLSSPSWSPDGTRLVFASIDKSGNNDLYVFNVQTHELMRLMNDFYDDRDPAWSPDGNTILFSSDRSAHGAEGKYNLFLYSLENGSISYATNGDFNCSAPEWSKDGKWIAFTSDIGGASNVWMMRYEPGRHDAEIRKATNFLTASFDPSWGASGEMYLTVFENFSFQIRRIDDVVARYDSSTSVVRMDLTEQARPWESKRLDSPSIVSTYKYANEYSLDIAQSQVSTDPVFGTMGGAVLAMSDLLGNDQYYFLIYNTAQVKSDILESFNVAISKISLGQRTSYAYGIFRFSGNRYDLTDPDLFYFERSFGGYFVLSYPFSKFKRVEAEVSVSNSEKDAFVQAPRKALLVSNSVSFVWDNSLSGPSGPLDGNRLKLTLAYTNDVQYSNVSYYTFIGDYRNYERLSERSAFASRFNVWYNEGMEARRFFMGGSWDLRGWDRWSIRGKKLWITSHELRFPFIDQLGIRFPIGGLAFNQIRGALYFDAGKAWDTDGRYQDFPTYGSVGAGLRLNLGGIIVLRYDFGKRIENNFQNFQDGYFHQFFFGWDF